MSAAALFLCLQPHEASPHWGVLLTQKNLADDWRHTGREDHGAQATFSNFFTDIRIHTIREMQEQVARDLGVPAYDFGETWEGWQRHQDMVHPNKVRRAPPFPVIPSCPGIRGGCEAPMTC